jgi:hypothetical protein
MGCWALHEHKSRDKDKGNSDFPKVSIECVSFYLDQADVARETYESLFSMPPKCVKFIPKYPYNRDQWL